jgi:predicted DCC family thiol-disulfide oxidoreductase YuxK
MSSPVTEAAKWSGGQYSLFRILLGIYLLFHFGQLLPYSAEVFSSAGMLGDGNLSPLLHVFPNIFLLNDAPWFVELVTGSAALASLFFIVGKHDKVAALWMWFVLACLFGRNPLIANPSMPYLGFMLLAHLFIPSAPYGSLAAYGRPDAGSGWKMPRDVFFATWIVLALSYSYSGYTKLMSPSWVSGDNINYVLNNPLARDYFLRDFMLWLPPVCLKVLTWSVLYLELAFAPLALSKRLRPFIWGGMLFIQLGFAFMLNFFDLTAAMLLFHLLTFDPSWVKREDIGERPVLFYDGKCGLCHRVIRFLLAEDHTGNVRYAPLQGKMFLGRVSAHKRAGLPDSIVLMTEDGVMHTQSSAVGMLLVSLGGLWRLLGHLLLACPKRLRDLGYDGVGRIRQYLFRRPDSLCPIVDRQLRERFIIWDYCN